MVSSTPHPQPSRDTSHEKDLRESLAVVSGVRLRRFRILRCRLRQFRPRGAGFGARPDRHCAVSFSTGSVWRHRALHRDRIRQGWKRDGSPTELFMVVRKSGGDHRAGHGGDGGGHGQGMQQCWLWHMFENHSIRRHSSRSDPRRFRGNDGAVSLSSAIARLRQESATIWNG